MYEDFQRRKELFTDSEKAKSFDFVKEFSKMSDRKTVVRSQNELFYNCLLIYCNLRLNNMLELVLANLKVRPFRTLISVIGVALGVVLVILFTGSGARNVERYGAARGELEGGNRFHASRRDGNDEFERFGFDRLRRTAYCEIEGVESTVPVIRYITPNANERWGIQQIDGVEWEPFAAMNEMQIVAGRARDGE